MAQIHGQIDSLKQIRSTLDIRGISRFNSINQLNDFLKNYRFEQKRVLDIFEKELEKDIDNLKKTISYDHEVLRTVRNKSLEKLNRKMIYHFNAISRVEKEFGNSILGRYIADMIIYFINTRLNYFQKNYDRIIEKATSKIEEKIKQDHQTLKRFVNDKEDEVLHRSQNEMKQLARIKEVVRDLNPLIAGAIGENLVVKEINKLSDDYILINDFSLKLNKAIRYKKDNSWIQTIQIDHLLISKAGIFILETKNWSKGSIESKKLWSPIEQINRSSYALFVLIARKNINLKNHLWSQNKQIPIRSIVVMINEKPKEQFKYVKIKTVKELNSYIEYFDPIFNDQELNKIYAGLISLA